MSTATFVSQLRQLKRLEKERARPAPWDCPDPVELARQAGLTLDDWQCEVAQGDWTRASINASRQIGKSTCAALVAVHTALAEPDGLVLCVAPSLRQSAEWFRSALSIYHKLDTPIRPRRESVLRIELQNNSRIVSLPGTEFTLRGFANCKLLILEESARIPDELYMAVLPFLAVSGGRLLTISSPAGARGWWWQAWKSEEAWSRWMIPAEDCPRIEKSFLAEMQEVMGAYYYNQEFRCIFNDPIEAAFPGWAIDAIIKPGKVEAWDLAS